jgi:hypothetical protein
MLWVLSVLLAALALWVFSGNVIGMIWAARTGKNYSNVPLLAGLLAVLALLTLPIDGARRFWWLPLIVDYTYFLTLYGVIVHGAFRRK